MAKLTTEQTMFRATSHEKKGEVDQARMLYKAILDAFPNNKRAQQALTALDKPNTVVSNKGTNPPQDQLDALVELYNKGQLSAAVDKAQLLVLDFPSSFLLWNILGAANAGLRRLPEAEVGFRKAAELNPNYADAHSNLGATLQDQGKLEGAIEAYQRALKIKPDHADAHYNMGNVLKDQGKRDEAIESYQLALKIKPDYANAHNNMGIVLKDQGKRDDAIESYQRALKIKPDHAEAHTNMGNVLKDQGKLDEAIESYQRALNIKPDYAEAYNNMGNVLKDQGKLDEAIEAYQRVLKIKPDYADAYYNKSHSHLLMGDFDEGWDLYEWRTQTKEKKVRKAREHLSWDGTKNISGKRFVVYEEQGLGDKIQFCRYLPLLVQENAFVTFQVTSALHSLLGTLDSNIILTNGLPSEDQIDFEVPLIQLLLCNS